MADKKEEKKEVSERQKLWDEYVANYKVKNPVKWEAKNARGQFDTIPDAFIGLKTVTKQANGTVRESIV